MVMSLLVTTVGIANSMLMSVTERFREIGTMKCLGATDSFVVRLFFVEAVFIGFIASMLGWVAGFGTAMVVRVVQLGWLPAWQGFYAGKIGFLFVMSTAIGSVLTMIATIAPAQRAAVMPAAAALRTEV